MLGLSNLIASVTQLYNRFFIYGISPLLYNAGIIFGIVFWHHVLVWRVWCGVWLLQSYFLVQVPFVARRGYFQVCSFHLKNIELPFAMFVVAFPRTLATVSSRVSEFFLISLASLMSAGSISILSLPGIFSRYRFRLWELVTLGGIPIYGCFVCKRRENKVC